ncbi:predicted protein [Naegleria gruberi]|uniref:Predicted protein n=1 Tax=Naegleria gruberi TaxID=5762 RepID=D2V5U2_NAEGR|nr:uncharacterized protein NAEGRDRAFT_57228 [Naegleria gruberi]EFC47854.1 predicted protein [Naegleria gruberi]|eukprot:XP_002680598.1 predicted protein [Naegleria gruberi strain NEG-M]
MSKNSSCNLSAVELTTIEAMKKEQAASRVAQHKEMPTTKTMAIALPLIFRFMRAFFMYKINLTKTKLFESNTIDSESKKHELVDQQLTLESIESLPPNSGAELVITKMDSFQVHGVNLQEVSNTIKGNNEHQQPVENSSYHSDGGSSNRTSSASTDDLDNDTISTTWSAADVKDMASLKKEMRKLQIYNFLVSTKFMGTVYLCSFIFGFIIWAILGGIDEALNSNSNNRIFVVESSMFEFRHGCSMTFYTVLTIGLEVVGYVILELIFLALCVKADKDTWGIKKESFIVTIVQLLSAILFIICGSIEVISELVDYYVPYGFFIWGYMYFELFMCCTIPVIRSIYFDYTKLNSNESNESNIEKVLKNKKMFKIMLDFARRSYCTESLQCWKDIQRYKRSTKNRKKIANHILQVYLSINSPLELNIPKIEQCNSEITSQLTEKPPANLFHKIQQHCLIDMTDLFERLKNSNTEFASFITSLKD